MPQGDKKEEEEDHDHDDEDCDGDDDEVRFAQVGVRYRVCGRLFCVEETNIGS